MLGIVPFGRGPILACPSTSMHPAEPSEPAITLAFPPNVDRESTVGTIGGIAKNTAPGYVYIYGVPALHMDGIRSIISSGGVTERQKAVSRTAAAAVPPLMIALALPPTLIGFLSQRLDKIGNCGRVTVTSIAVSPATIGCQ